MSIQPNRILARIVEQVDRSDWPELEVGVFCSPGAGELLRLYAARSSERYATAIHFWVHALRDELASRGRRADLVGAAGQALCRSQPLPEWRRELATSLAPARPASLPWRAVLDRASRAGRAYRMLESACRRSSVMEDGEWLVAHFWGHGLGESWRGRMIR